MYIDKLDEIVNQCNNTYHKAIKLEPANVKSSSHIDFGVENNDKDHKFEVGDHVRTSKYKSIFAKTYTPNWSEEEFIIKKFKNTVFWTYVVSDLNDEEAFGRAYEKELQKTNKTEFKVEKVIKRKGDKLYVK